MDWRVSDQFVCKYVWIVAVIAYIYIHTTGSSDVKTDKAFYHSVPVRNALDYRSVTLLEITVPPQAALVSWNFTGVALSDAPCCDRDIIINIQHGGYPLLYTDHKMYPANFYLRRSSVHTFTIGLNDSHSVLNFDSPHPGTWFLAAYLAHVDDGSLDCMYMLQLNVTSLVTSDVQQILANDIVDVTLHNDTAMFKILSGDTTWKLTISVSDCAINGSLLDHCPVVMSVRSGGLPGNDSDSVVTNCSLNPCILHVVNPLVGRWFFIKLDNLGNDTVTARLKADIQDCGYAEHDVPDNGTLTSHNASLPDCPPVYTLRRIENPGIRFSVEYSFNPALDKILIVILNASLNLVEFNVAPMKDTGGTLTFRASLESLSDTFEQRVVLHVCLRRGAVPVSEANLQCPSHDLIELSSWGSNASVVRFFPYPEPGPWFLGLQGWCLPLNETNVSQAEPCRNATVTFSLRSAACLDLTCANTGMCYLAHRGSYLLSTCKCQAGWRGYGCTDGSHTRSLALQMTFTLLLTLTNLAFIPAIIVSIYRRHFVEALVYSFNMVFSGLYHACDVASWSVYYWCVLPFGVLSHCDFFASILSFVVTLVAMAGLSRGMTSFVHTVNVLFLVLAVEWQQHSMMTFFVPTVFCLVVVIATRGHKFYKTRLFDRSEWCVMGPGVVLAVIGMCLFAFAETHENYPVIHSVWHVCMALCVVFLLPKRKMSIKEENIAVSFRGGLREFALIDTPTSDDDDLLPIDIIL